MSAAALERLIEAKIATAISAAVTDRQIMAFRTAAAAGTVKRQNASSVSIRIAPRECEGWDSDLVTLHAVVIVQAAAADDATGASLQSAFETVMGIFDGWDSDDDAAAAALEIAGLFACDAVMFAPGGDNGYDDATSIWYETIMLDITGRILRP